MTTESNKAMDKREDAPPNSLPDWTECQMRVENSKFIAKRVAEGGYPAEPDSKLANELHHFIYEYDDADPYRSAWFLHRLEKLITFVQEQALSQRAPTAAAEGDMSGVRARLQNSVNWQVHGRHTGELVGSGDFQKLIAWLDSSPAPASTEAAPVVPSDAARKALETARAQIKWLAFGECRADGWEGPPPTAAEAVAAIDAALSTPQAVEAQQAGSGGEPPSLWAVEVDGKLHAHFCATTYAGAEGVRDRLRAQTAPCDLLPMRIVPLCVPRAAPAEPAMVLSYEQRRAVMEAERNASLEAHERGMLLGDTGRRVYEAAFTNGWDRAVLALAQGGAK